MDKLETYFNEMKHHFGHRNFSDLSDAEKLAIEIDAGFACWNLNNTFRALALNVAENMPNINPLSL